MKKILYLLTLMGLLVGCDLTESPYTVSQENIKNDPEGAGLYVTSIYNVFWDSYMMKKTYMEWIDMDHDHASAEAWVVSGAGMGNVTTHWGYNGGSDLFFAFYRIVNRANFALENIPNHTEMKEEDRNQLMGEAYFLRAYAYFHLVRMYGPLPLRLEFITDKDMERSSVKAVYEQIITDLEKSIDLMNLYAMDTGNWGRASKTAARLLLAKVYANMGSGALSGSVDMKVNIKGTVHTFATDAVAGYDGFDAGYCYDKVKVLCDSIILDRGNGYDLKPGYTDIWGGNNFRNNEFIWGITAHDDYKSEHLNYYYTPYTFGGRGWAGIPYTLYHSFEPTDDRAVKGVFHYVKRSLTSTNFERFPNDPALYGTGPDGKATTFTNFTNMVCINKWYIGNITNPTIDETNPTYQKMDIPMMRFAEAYLLRAEALNELNNPAGALSDLDVIRARANASLKSGTTTDKVEIRSLIFEERGFEFLQEFNRKFDLLRWGLYLDVMNTTQNVATKYGSTISKVREPRSLLYAVPTSETTVNKLFGPNNTGW